MTTFSTFLYAVGITHGMVLAAVFYAWPHGLRRVNRLFAALMLLTSMDLAFAFYFQSALFFDWPHLIRVNSPLNYLHGPVLYLFVCALVQPNFRLRKLHALHFLPVVLRALWSLDFYVSPGIEKIVWLEAMQARVSLESYVLGAFWQTQRLIYTFAALFLIWRHRHHRAFRWTVPLIVLFTLTWITALNRYLALFDAGIHLPRATQTFFMYAIAYIGLIRAAWFHQETTRIEPKYATTGLSREEAANLFSKANELVAREQLHLQHGLTLQALAKQLGVNSRQLSQAINQHAGQGFNDFVNARRIESFLTLLKDPTNQAFTLEALASEAGFNATSTFNSAFKKQMGTTPSRFRKALEHNTCTQDK